MGPKGIVPGDSRKLHNEHFHRDVLLTKHCSVDQIKNEMGDASGTHGGREKYIQGFGGETKRKAITWKIQAQMEA